jgi:hypothetical protein
MGILRLALTASGQSSIGGPRAVVAWAVPTLFFIGSFLNQNAMAERVFAFAPGDNGFELFVVRVTATVAALLHLLICALLAALVATAGRVMLGKDLQARTVIASIGEAHLPLLAWVVWTAYVVHVAQISDPDALRGIVLRIHMLRTVSYAAAVLLLAYRLCATCDLTCREGGAAVLPPVCILVCGFWSVNAVMALMPG